MTKCFYKFLGDNVVGIQLLVNLIPLLLSLWNMEQDEREKNAKTGKGKKGDKQKGTDRRFWISDLSLVL